MPALAPSPSAERALAHRDVVMVLGYTSWAAAADRGRVHAEDRLTLELISSPRVRRLLVSNPFRSLPAQLLRGRRDAAEPFPAGPGRSLHQPLRLRRTDPTGAAAIERSVRRYERGLRAAAAERGLERPAVIVTHPLIAGFGEFEWAGPVTYYANDDLSAHPPLRRWWPAYELAYERARARGRRVVALTPASLRSVSPSGPSAVIPCGVEPREWLTPGPAPDWFLALPRPRAVYVGSLDGRIDVAAVRRLAAALEGGSVVLIGPGDGAVDQLGSLANVHLRPPLGRRQVVAVTSAADVGLIPHVRDRQTAAMSPLKLFEYLAAGLPVAATDLPGIAGAGAGRVVLAAGPAEFPAALAAALRLGRADEDTRLELIAANSWSRRFEQLLDLALLPAPEAHPDPKVED